MSLRPAGTLFFQTRRNGPATIRRDGMASPVSLMATFVSIGISTHGILSSVRNSASLEFRASVAAEETQIRRIE